MLEASWLDQTVNQLTAIREFLKLCLTAIRRIPEDVFAAMCKVAGSDLSKDKDLDNGTSQMDGKEILDRRKTPSGSKV